MTSTRRRILPKETALDRKVSVPISMPQSLLADIDGLKGDIPRSVFVCKVLRAGIKVEREDGGGEGDSHVHQ